ncbi:MAG: hypothetical protein E7Z75_00010 [Methanobrevibacter olleyae]|uniref:Right handed beta helix domain-containing protein n=1 Tax=Methanobrevibacter olleyae TaxID=294671 RepID=A0A8T3VJY8_METOL|nr:hypothetical protein [Methanobrevibacter olleyae]
MILKIGKLNNLKNNHFLFLIFLIILIFSLISSVSALDNLNNENYDNNIVLESNNDLYSSNSLLSDNNLKSDIEYKNENNIRSMNSVHDIHSNTSNDDIQFIFDNSKDGDTIQFNDKEYNNISIIVNKRLNIISKSDSIIHTSSSINDKANKNGMIDSFGFYFTELARGSVIKGITLQVNSEYGIMVKDANNITIRDNKISGGKKAGLLLRNSSFNTIINNNITKSYDGLRLENVNRTIINNNNIYSNKRNGLVLDGVFLNNITRNYISKNKLDGFLLMNAKSNRILNNTIIDNANSGLRLEGNTTRNTIQYNNISANVMNIYANSLTNGDIISQNTLMHAKKSSDTYTTLDNTGAAIVFAENYSSSQYGKMLFERNSIGFNEQWDAKSTMDHPPVDIGANWYFDNDGEYGLGHICPMVFGKALDPEDFKHLSMGFGGDENGLFGQLYNGNTPNGAGAFDIDNVNINGKDYGSVRVGEDGRFDLKDLDLEELPSGSIITITIGSHSFNITIADKFSSNKTKVLNESTKAVENKNVPNDDFSKKYGSNIKSLGNGTGSGSGSNEGSGTGEGNFTGSGVSVGDLSGQSNQGTGDSGENGGGSASEGRAYEILKEENTPVTAKNSQLIALFGVALVILIIALGYRSKNKDDYKDDGDYSL